MIQKTCVFLVMVLFGFSGWSAVEQRDDRQPSIMLWPELKSQTQRQFRMQIEKSYSKEKVYSNYYEKIIEKSELGTYDFEGSYDLNENIHLGMQFGETVIPLINLGLSFNAQYDFYRRDNSKMAVGAMYGGILYPDERYGAQFLYAANYKELPLYYSFQWIRSRRYFLSAKSEGGELFLDNSLKYNLNSYLHLVGFTFLPGKYLNLMDSARFNFFMGYEFNQVLSTYKEKFTPAQYRHSDALYLGFNFVYYIKDKKVTPL